ncbi:hypothetical protein Cus16_3219 [Curtobacterium sp. ER1/6]|nr:hypothetical protein Cus16_3219 [Curtobacterium sp. ER1/6]
MHDGGHDPIVGGAADARSGSGGPRLVVPRSPADGGVAGRRRSRSEPGQVAGVGVRRDHLGPVLAVAHDGHRGRADGDALEQVEVHAECVGEDGLHDVAVAHRHPDRRRPVGCLDLGVDAADRRDRPGLHGLHGLAAGEDDGARVGLHGPPERLLRQVGELAPLPLPVVRLGDRTLDADLGVALLSGEHGAGGLPAPLEGARDERGERDRRDAVGGTVGLVAADTVEGDPGGPAGEHTGRVRRGAPVPEEEDGRHADDPTGAAATRRAFVGSFLERCGRDATVDAARMRCAAHRDHRAARWRAPSAGSSDPDRVRAVERDGAVDVLVPDELDGSADGCREVTRTRHRAARRVVRAVHRRHVGEAAAAGRSPGHRDLPEHDVPGVDVHTPADAALVRTDLVDVDRRRPARARHAAASSCSALGDEFAEVAVGVLRCAGRNHLDSHG